MGLTQITTGGVDENINIDSNTLKVDGTNNRVGIGTSSPVRDLQLGDNTSASEIISLQTTTSGKGSIYFGDNSATSSEYAGMLRYDHADNSMQFRTSSTERLRINSSGNVGIGTTSPQSLLSVKVSASRQLDVIKDSGDDHLVLKSTAPDASYNLRAIELSGERVAFSTGASSGTSYSERMRIDSSGNVGIGQTSAAANLHVKSGANDGNAVLRVEGSTNNNLDFSFNSTGADINVTASDPLLFSIAGTERMRVDNFGRVGIGTSNFATNSGVGIKLNYATSTPSVDLVCDTGANNTFLHLYNINATNNGYRFYVLANGGIRNFSANNSNLCDEREKKNIVALDNKWDSVKAWDLKKFHYNDNSDTDDKLYGVIAQQVEEHCPEVITDWLKQKAEDAVLDEDGNVVTPAVPEILRKGVKEQQMMWMAIKALQEAQTRIETLETQNASLEARLTALEGGAS